MTSQLGAGRASVRTYHDGVGLEGPDPGGGPG